MSKKIKLIVGSTRYGRIGKPISDWVIEKSKTAGIDLEVLDLEEINLPFFKGKSPAYFPPETPEGIAWAEMVGSADGFIFLTPEYNRSVPAPLKNAIDFLATEWKEKPAIIVSYGYIDGGASASKHLLDIFSWLKIQNAGEVNLELNREMLNESGSFDDVNASLAGYNEQLSEALKALNK